jgi:hypothetical protein
MKIYSEQAERWLRMNKLATFEIFEGDRKSPLYIYSESDGNTETAATQLNETLEELVNGEYRIRGKKNAKDPNSSYAYADLVKGETPQTATREPQNLKHSMNEALNIQQQLFEKEKELIHKDYENKELLRRITSLEEKFDKLLKQIVKFEDHFNECMSDHGNSKETMRDTIKSGVSNLVSQGTKVAFDRFGNAKV